MYKHTQQRYRSNIAEPTRHRRAASYRLPPGRITCVVLMTLLGMTGALAHGSIQRQVDPENGITTYLFRPSPERSMGKQEPQRSQPTVARTASSQIGASATGHAAPRTVERGGMLKSSYRDFPWVSPATQKERDLERRRILEQELAWEQEALGQALAERAADIVVRRHSENIEALNREIRTVHY